MCGEFWCGWFDHWYEQHHTRTPEDIAADTRELLESSASINYYMFHGGTNFGFTNGANHDGGYQPRATLANNFASGRTVAFWSPVCYNICKAVVRRFGAEYIVGGNPTR